MIWAKRRFEAAAYAPYMDRLRDLMLVNPARYREFIMISTKTDKSHLDEYYIGVPNEAFLRDFKGFEVVREEDLPTKIDAFHLGDGGKSRSAKSSFLPARSFRPPVNRHS